MAFNPWFSWCDQWQVGCWCQPGDPLSVDMSLLRWVPRVRFPQVGGTRDAVRSAACPHGATQVPGGGVPVGGGALTITIY
eukprot:645416-Pyramimonas_sp.AAC.1